MQFFRQSYFSPLLHVAIWVLLLAIPTIIFGSQANSYGGLSHNFFLLTSIYHIGIFYLIAYVLYPKLLTKKRWYLFIISIAVIIFISYNLKLFLLQINPQFQVTEDVKRIIKFGIVPFIIASLLFRLISDRIRFERLEKEARAERLSSELKFLRSQVSPHFLFNMMTNMVSLARQKSTILEPSLIKLSELLRYMLYDSDKEQISLQSEILHLENYIALQQLRFGEDVDVSVNIQNNCKNCVIEPMLLIPFIENAFKHGIGTVTNPFINIQLTAEKNKLIFKAVNNYSSDNLSKDQNSGIGLVNVKNRLELLYKNKYMLKIKDDKKTFSVQLNLDLL